MIKNKKIGIFDSFMILVSGFLTPDTIASNTSLGISSLTWWLILGLFYMIPTGLIIGELTNAFPKQGGIYIWIKQGLGNKFAALTAWLFFCGEFFFPVSSAIMISDITFNILAPKVSLVVRVIVAIVLIWVMFFIAITPLNESKWLTNTAGIIKLTLFSLCFLAGIFYLMRGNSVANNISVKNLIPTFNEGLTYLPVILFCCQGMEVASASAEDTKNPAKNLPRVVGGIALISIVLNILSSLGMLTVIPLKKIDVNTGLTDLIAKGFNLPILYYAVSFIFLIALFSQVVTWIIGANRGTAESGKIGDLPAFLGRENRYGMPIGAMFITVLIGTLLLIFYAIFAKTASNLFFSLLSSGVIGSLIPYIFMLIAYQKIKKREKINKKSYYFRAPAGVFFSWICQLFQIFTLFLMIYVPGKGWNSDVFTNGLGGSVMIISGLLIIYYQEKRKSKLHNKRRI